MLRTSEFGRDLDWATLTTANLCEESIHALIERVHIFLVHQMPLLQIWADELLDLVGGDDWEELSKSLSPQLHL